MMDGAVEDIRRFIADFLNTKLQAQGSAAVGELADDYDLLLSGALDSMGFIELMTAAAGHFGRNLDFDALDPEQMTIVGPLCAFISNQPLDPATSFHAKTGHKDFVDTGYFPHLAPQARVISTSDP